MKKEKVSREDDAGPAVLPGFKPLRCLWEGASPPFPSESVVRWQIRKLGKALADAQALAYYQHQLWVHPERFCQVVSQEAINHFGKLRGIAPVA